MKKLLSVITCLLLILLLAAPVCATEVWESELDFDDTYSLTEPAYEPEATENTPAEESAPDMVYDTTVVPGSAEEAEKNSGVSAATDLSDIGNVDGKPIITYGSVLPPESATAVGTPVAVNLVITILLIAIGVAVAIALLVLIILLIVRAKKKA